MAKSKTPITDGIKNWTKNQGWRCPHCYSAAPRRCCRTCLREMCNDCISDDPEVGPVCGLCYDRKYHPEPEETR